MDIFDKISDGIFSAGKNLSQCAKGISEVSHLKQQIAHISSRKQEVMAELGAVCYKELNANNAVSLSHEEIRSLANELGIIEEQLSQLQEQLDTAKGVRICPSCKTEVDTAFRYCATCGKKLVPDEKPSEPVMEVVPDNTGFDEGISDNTRDF